MNQFEQLEQEFRFPFKLHPYQYEAVKEALPHSGWLFREKVGLGKSAISLYLGLYRSLYNDVEQILILCPPMLIDQWVEFLGQVEGIPGCLVYRGTPAERKQMDLKSEAIVIMSYNIFRLDYPKVEKWGKVRNLFIIGDELSLKSANQTYKKFKTLVYRKLRIDPYKDGPKHYFCALNATPVSDRKNVYWWSSIFRPDLYPSLRLFEIQHVAATDHWGQPTAWRGEEEMDKNFDSFSSSPREAQLDLPDTVFAHLPYVLDPRHAKLYKNISEAEFAGLPEDAVQQMIEALFSTLQRVVLLPADYGLDIRPPILDIIDQKLDQLDEEDRLIIYTRHVRVSEMLCQHYPQAVAVFGGVADKVKKESLRRFKAGEAEIMIANLDSLSKGQNLQVANHTLFAELPFRSDMMTQACGRTARQGQKRTCFFHIPVAKKTIQTQIWKRLLANDMDLRNFNRNKKTLKEFLGMD